MTSARYYDPKANVAYIHFVDEPVEVETRILSDCVHIDLAPDGSDLRHRVDERERATAAGDGGGLVVKHTTRV